MLEYSESVFRWGGKASPELLKSNASKHVVVLKQYRKYLEFVLKSQHSMVKPTNRLKVKINGQAYQLRGEDTASSEVATFKLDLVAMVENGREGTFSVEYVRPGRGAISCRVSIDGRNTTLRGQSDWKPMVDLDRRLEGLEFSEGELHARVEMRAHSAQRRIVGHGMTFSRLLTRAEYDVDWPEDLIVNATPIEHTGIIGVEGFEIPSGLTRVSDTAWESPDDHYRVGLRDGILKMCLVEGHELEHVIDLEPNEEFVDRLQALLHHVTYDPAIVDRNAYVFSKQEKWIFSIDENGLKVDKNSEPLNVIGIESDGRYLTLKLEGNTGLSEPIPPPHNVGALQEALHKLLMRPPLHDFEDFPILHPAGIGELVGKITFKQTQSPQLEITDERHPSLRDLILMTNAQGQLGVLRFGGDFETGFVALDREGFKFVTDVSWIQAGGSEHNKYGCRLTEIRVRESGEPSSSVRRIKHVEPLENGRNMHYFLWLDKRGWLKASKSNRSLPDVEGFLTYEDVEEQVSSNRTSQTSHFDPGNGSQQDGALRDNEASQAQAQERSQPSFVRHRNVSSQDLQRRRNNRRRRR